MKKSLAILLSAIFITSSVQTISADSTVPRWVEGLTRGSYGVATKTGVYLSWRLLGTEPINQTFDIYKDNVLLASGVDKLNYTDSSGKSSNTYSVVPHGKKAAQTDAFAPFSNDYIDVSLNQPASGYIINDASCGDVDNDGGYELIIKWDPSNKQDNANEGITGNVYIDCYELSGEKKWRIDLGKNIRAGDHYTQFIVYDFNGDGSAEMALRTAPGSKDSKGSYVSSKGTSINGEALSWKDSYTGTTYTDTSTLYGSNGHIIKGPDWLTMFNGETGEAMSTVNFYPQRGNVKNWGDDYGNRSERFLAGVAYLDGERPSLIMSRGYYARAGMATYNWDGEKFIMLWSRLDTKKGGNLYSNGNHQLSVCDADNDGKDEIVFGSTIVDDDGSILNSTDHGHGDALHVSDFDNDGEQEIFQVHEDSAYYVTYGGEYRKAKDATILAKVGATADVGRGVMANFDDSIGKSEFATSITEGKNKTAYDISGNEVGSIRSDSLSFFAWWDGDLDRDGIYKCNNVSAYNVSSGTSSTLRDFEKDILHTVGKEGPLLTADILGDWREEIMYPYSDNTAIRIYLTTTSTNYKIPTLMHDTQYRCAVAWQNVGYNQPPHPKFYVGKAALSGTYLAPATGYDTVIMTGGDRVLSTPEPTAIPTATPEPTPEPDMGEELLVNGSFEDELLGTDGWKFTNTGGWYNEATTGADRATEEKTAGSYSVKLIRGTIGQRIKLEAGKTYILKASIKSDTSGYVSLGFYDGTQKWPTTTGNEVCYKEVEPTTDWQEVSIVFECDKTQDYVVCVKSWKENTVYCDNVMLSEAIPLATTPKPEEYISEITANMDENGSISYNLDYSTSKENSDLYVAVYDGSGRLIACTVNKTEGIIETSNGEGKCIIKAFLWNDTEPMLNAMQVNVY